MPVTLERLQEAANSLGLTASCSGEALDVQPRPYLTLRVRRKPGGFEIINLLRGHTWLARALTFMMGLWLGFFFIRYRPHRLDLSTLSVLFCAALVLGGQAWNAWLLFRTREKLFSRAYDMERRQT